MVLLGSEDKASEISSHFGLHINVVKKIWWPIHPTNHNSIVIVLDHILPTTSMRGWSDSLFTYFIPVQTPTIDNVNNTLQALHTQLALVLNNIPKPIFIYTSTCINFSLGG